MIFKDRRPMLWTEETMFAKPNEREMRNLLSMTIMDTRCSLANPLINKHGIS